MREILKKVFKVEFDDPYIKYRIFGIQFKYTSYHRKLSYQILQESLALHKHMDMEFKRLETINYAKIMNIVEESLSTYRLHQKSFEAFKNKYMGRDVVLCGSGTSLNDYVPIEGAIHVALNRAFSFRKVKFDYVFAQDSRSMTAEVMEELSEYEKDTCIKFIGTQNGNKSTEIAESYANNSNMLRYNTDGFIWDLGGGGKFIKDIASRSIGNFNTIAFPAMQFILYTNPRKIYIVGCDSQRSGHFNAVEQERFSNEELDEIYNMIVTQWEQLREFADFYYPNTEIVSINPVGLKGIFKDIYTKE